MLSLRVRPVIFRLATTTCGDVRSRSHCLSCALSKNIRHLTVHALPNGWAGCPEGAGADASVMEPTVVGGSNGFRWGRQDVGACARASLSSVAWIFVQAPMLVQALSARAGCARRSHGRRTSGDTPIPALFRSHCRDHVGRPTQHKNRMSVVSNPFFGASICSDQGGTSFRKQVGNTVS